MVEAVAILIDNSAKSINGDIYPTRLEAQKTAADRFIKYIQRSNKESQFAIGTLGSTKNDVNTSLTSDANRIAHSIVKIQHGGKASLVVGINRAFLVLRNRDLKIKKARVVVFVSSEHDLVGDKIDQIINSANNAGVGIDIITVGPDVNNQEDLRHISERLKVASHYLHVPDSSSVLSDQVLSSQIGSGDPMTSKMIDLEPDNDLRYALQQSRDDNDPDLREAIKASLIESGSQEIADNDPELSAAIKASLQDTGPNMLDEDEELLAAIKESLRDSGPNVIEDPNPPTSAQQSKVNTQHPNDSDKSNTNVKTAEGEVEEIDSELLEAINTRLAQPHYGGNANSLLSNPTQLLQMLDEEEDENDELGEKK